MVTLDLTRLTKQEVTEIRHPKTNQLVMVLHTRGGVMHRDDGPAAIHYDFEGNEWAQEWYRNGTVHREDGPARMYINHPVDGRNICEWYFSGQYMSKAVLDDSHFQAHLHKAK